MKKTFCKTVAPQIVAFSFGDRPANSGESMSASCSVSAGDNPLEFSWFFDNEKLTAPDEQEILISTSKRRSFLEIEAVKAHHAGRYTCSVSNEAGATSHSTILVVNGKWACNENCVISISFIDQTFLKFRLFLATFHFTSLLVSFFK